MAELIDDGRLNLFFVKDKELSQVADEDLEIEDTYNYTASTETSFEIVAEWICNAKTVLSKEVFTNSSGVETGSEEGTLSRATQSLDGTVIPIDLVGVSSEAVAGTLYWLTGNTAAPKPSWHFFSDDNPITDQRWSLLPLLNFWCGYNEKWYHKHEQLGEYEGQLNIESIEITKSKITVIEETFGSKVTTTHEITDTFY
jgi:hypothetical protein